MAIAVLQCKAKPLSLSLQYPIALRPCCCTLPGMLGEVGSGSVARYSGPIPLLCRYQHTRARPRKVRHSMTLHQLRIFLAVAQTATLTRASKQLRLAQPSLSHQLARLEESVGTRLFDRARNRMELTDAGRVFLRHAQSIVPDASESDT